MPAIEEKRISKKINTRPIGVFDSGVGGLSVLLKLKRLLPKENFVFLADQLYVPYGEKNKKELVNRVYKITDYLRKRHDIKMMVVACNTATCAAIGELRNKYSLPIVGTVPAIKKAAENTKTKKIAVISTPSTSKSLALQKLIKDYCQGIKVLNIGCKDLEDAVERGELMGGEVRRLLFKYLDRIKNSKIDQLVLGCTHYPFLKQAIVKIVGPGVNLLDGGEGIARHAKSLLSNYLMENNAEKKEKIIYLTTGDPKKFSKIASKLMKEKIKSRKVAF